MSVPTRVVPRKNSTFVTLPSESEASASYEMAAGAVKLAPFAGEVSATVGLWLLATVTFRVVAVDDRTVVVGCARLERVAARADPGLRGGVGRARVRGDQSRAPEELDH